MKDKHRTKFVTKDIFKSSVIGAFTKLNPKYMMHNPVMFVVEIGFVIALLLSIFPELFGPTDGINNVRLYNIFVCVILFVTVLFANFAEAVAEGRGKAQAESLKKTQKDTKARLLKADGTETVVSSSELKKGDVVMVSAGEIIPNDGEVIEGTASVDESAITGESAPVLRESGGDFASVTGGTTVVSDWLKIRITSNPGESFLDKMIALVEGASRKKTPNEIALQILLVALTIIFMIVIVTLYPIGRYSGVTLPVSTLIALAVCLIPTTIGALLSAIGIAGMDRVTRFNVIAMSGKAVEACGDVDTMILDKTGTITYGNRMAADFIPVSGVSVEELRRIRGEGETLWAYLEEGQALRAKVLTAADTFGAVEWRRVSGMNTVMTDYFALAPRHARDAILPIKHPLRTDDIHYIQAQKQTLLLYTAYDRVRARLGFQAMALLLDGEPQFLICPGGLILNTDKVSRVEGRVVALENGKRLMLEEPAVRELQARRAVRLSHMQAQTV